MSWVRFLEDFDYRKPAFTIAYKAGMTQNVTAQCATLAVAAGRAVRLRKASRDSEPVGVEDAENDSVQSAIAALPTDTGAGTADRVSRVAGGED